MCKPKITVMGSYVTDLMARAPHLPVHGETVFGSLFKTGCGGKGSNQAVAAARVGADVLIITKLGKDVFGEMALENFRKEKINVSFVIVDEEYETGAALIMVDEITSANKILVVPGACGKISDDDIENARSEIEGCSILLTQLETNMEAVQKTIDIAGAKKVRIILNPAPVQQIPDDLYEKIEVIIPNEVEAEILSGVKVDSEASAKKAAEFFLCKGVKKVIITLGDNGVYANDGKAGTMIPPHKVEAIDTTGAGDSFCGAFVAAYAEGKSFVEAVRFGNAAAAISVTRMGTAVAMPYREEVEAFIKL